MVNRLRRGSDEQHLARSKERKKKFESTVYYNTIMSLVPYGEMSLILRDRKSRSLVIVNPSLGKLSYYRQTPIPNDQSNNDSSSGNNLGVDLHSRTATRGQTVSSYICPQCGSEIDTAEATDEQFGGSTSNQQRYGNGNNVSGNQGNSSFGGRAFTNADFRLSPRYFKLLQDAHKSHQSLPNVEPDAFNAIPEELFVPGYFHKFFKTLSLLGNGARGSVYKVVHKIGDTSLGVFALKKIAIGNDMDWFNKCIREVKALSSITHKSVNLITYNHVWLEMDTPCGVTGTRLDEEKIPCLFILQQYCEGGNLEDCIINDVFKKYPELKSKDERKRKFREMRRRRSSKDTRPGLSTKQILSIVRDIARGLRELHAIGIIHRDLKPSNVLLLNKYEATDVDRVGTEDDSFPTVLIGDLGESQLAGESRSGTGCTGTLEFTAPEVIITGDPTPQGYKKRYTEYTYASDMYSLGMLCYFIIFCDTPFDPQLDIPELRNRVRSFRVSKEAMLEKYMHSNCRPIDPKIFDLVESLLSTSPAKRPTARDVEVLLDHILIGSADNVFPKGISKGGITTLDGDPDINPDSMGDEEEEETEDNSLMLVPTLGKELMVTGPVGLLTLPDSPTWEEPIAKGDSKPSNFGSRLEKGSHYLIGRILQPLDYRMMAIPLAVSIVGMNRDGWVVNSLSMILLGASFNCKREKVKLIVLLLLLLGIIRVLLDRFWRIFV